MSEIENSELKADENSIVAKTEPAIEPVQEAPEVTAKKVIELNPENKEAIVKLLDSTFTINLSKFQDDLSEFYGKIFDVKDGLYEIMKAVETIESETKKDVRKEERNHNSAKKSMYGTHVSNFNIEKTNSSKIQKDDKNLPRSHTEKKIDQMKIHSTKAIMRVEKPKEEKKEEKKEGNIKDNKYESKRKGNNQNIQNEKKESTVSVPPPKIKGFDRLKNKEKEEKKTEEGAQNKKEAIKYATEKEKKNEKNEKKSEKKSEKKEKEDKGKVKEEKKDEKKIGDKKDLKNKNTGKDKGDKKKETKDGEKKEETKKNLSDSPKNQAKDESQLIEENAATKIENSEKTAEIEKVDENKVVEQNEIENKIENEVVQESKNEEKIINDLNQEKPKNNDEEKPTDSGKNLDENKSELPQNEIENKILD